MRGNIAQQRRIRKGPSIRTIKSNVINDYDLATLFLELVLCIRVLFFVCFLVGPRMLSVH